jgi:hypothetical protein
MALNLLHKYDTTLLVARVQKVLLVASIVIGLNIIILAHAVPRLDYEHTNNKLVS